MKPRRRFARGLRVRMAEHDRELVAADARHDVALANAVDEQPRDLDQRFVAGLVAEAVVDLLQAVEVDKQQRGFFLVAADAVDQPLERSREAAPVRKSDEAVLVRQHVELLDALLKLRDRVTKLVDFAIEPFDVGDVGRLIRHCPPSLCPCLHSET